MCNHVWEPDMANFETMFVSDHKPCRFSHAVLGFLVHITYCPWLWFTLSCTTLILFLPLVDLITVLSIAPLRDSLEPEY